MKIKKSELRSMIREEISRSKKISLSEGFLSKIFVKIVSNAIEKEMKDAGIEDFDMNKTRRDVSKFIPQYKKSLPKDSPYRKYL